MHPKCHWLNSSKTSSAIVTVCFSFGCNFLLQNLLWKCRHTFAKGLYVYCHSSLEHHRVLHYAATHGGHVTWCQLCNVCLGPLLLLFLCVLPLFLEACLPSPQSMDSVNVSYLRCLSHPFNYWQVVETKLSFGIWIRVVSCSYRILLAVAGKRTKESRALSLTSW